MLLLFSVVFVFFFFKQKTAYEMRISDWSSDVCSSDLGSGAPNSLRARNARRSVRRSPRHPRSATGRAAASALLLLRGGGVFGAFAAFTLLHPLAGDDIIDHLGDVGRMVAHAFQILGDEQQKIGRASCRERVCQYVKISVVA